MGKVHDPQAPATKQDLHNLEVAVKKDIDILKSDVATLKSDVSIMKDDVRSVKNDFVKLELWKDEMMTAMRDWKDEIIHQMQIIAENMHYDFLGAHTDKIQNHENRIVRLETHVKLAPL
jgi:hypothetical protein